MLTGAEIADQIEQLMAEKPRTSKTEIGALLMGEKSSSPQAQRKRYASLLKRLREEKIIGELRVVAGYLGVSVEDLVFKDF